MTVSDLGGRALMSAVFLLASIAVGTAQTLIQGNPLGPVPASGAVVRLEPFVQMPQSSGSNPRAQLSVLHVDPSEEGVLWVNDQRGQLYRIREGSPQLYMNLSALRAGFTDSPGLGAGFQSFALHPEFADNGRIYTVHTETTSSGSADFTGPLVSSPFVHGVVMEWTATDPSAATFSGASREILRVALPHQIHGIQEVAFNPNATSSDVDYGLIYVTIGDGGSYNVNQSANLNRTDSLYGTVLRIDPQGTDGPNGAYGIPEDNPFANSQDSAVRREIYAYGFRNPHRIVFQPRDQALDPQDPWVFVNDIGERNIEEVNLLKAGANYGWPWREGTFLFRGESTAYRDNIYELPANDAEEGYTYPIAQWDRSDENGRAVGSGIFYGGAAIPELRGHYVMGNIPEAELYHFPVTSIIEGSQAPVFELFVESATGIQRLEDIYTGRVDIRMGVDHDGEMLVMVKNDGMIYRMFSDTRRWGQFPVLAGDWLDSGAWLGLIHVGRAPWIYSASLKQWAYWPGQLEGPGAWIFVKRP